MTDLQHDDRHAGLGAGGQPLAQPRPAVVLEIQRDRADAGLIGEELEVFGGRHDRLVATRDHRVKAQTASRRECIDGDVAALGDERHRPRLGRGERVAPQRDAVPRRHDAIAVGSADRQPMPCRGGEQLAVELHALGNLGEAGADHNCPTAASGARLLNHLGHAGGRDRNDQRVDRYRQIGDRRHARDAAHLVAARVDAPYITGIADRLQVLECLRAVGSRPVGRADDRDRARRQQPPEVDPGLGPDGGQWIVASTPRRSSAREMIRRWTSLVPSQIRSTRSSRRNRSAT
jgi:hypothetical protein